MLTVLYFEILWLLLLLHALHLPTYLYLLPNLLISVMASSLPLELVFRIAAYVHHAGNSLAPYTTVCCQWQAAFELLIYPRLVVYSQDDHPGRGISLSQFQTLTSGAGARRRAWVRHLVYRIIVPYDLPDYTTRKKKGCQYNLENPVREANDRAFQNTFVGLLNTLSAWHESYRVSVQLGQVLG
jgi:hypothetical protein